MGRLVGLELNNFKSYKGKTLVGFGTSYFTSIIGPNGSGKSNMMDAISFVLGVRSNQLRSKNIKSLIYRGAIGENPNRNTDANVADIDDDSDDEGIETNENDPDSAYVIAVYEKSNKEILNLKRSINPNGTSTFSVNGVDVSVNQYLNILKDENILIKAKNFLVFQGDVEKVASQSPQDLTKMIENISGSVNLKDEFDGLKDAKDKAHSITSLKNSQRRNLKDEIKVLKAKCLESDQFDKKKKELEKLTVTKFLSKLNYDDRLFVKLSADLEIKNKESISLLETIKQKQEEYKEFVRVQSDEHMTIKEYESKIESDESSLKTIKTTLIPLESEAIQLHKKIKDYDSKIERLSLEMEDQNLVIKQTDEVLNDIQNIYDRFKKEKEEASEKIQSTYTDNIEMLTEYNKLRDKFLLTAGDIESKLRDLNDEKDSIIIDIDALKSSKLIIQSRITDLESKKAALESKHKSAESTVNSALESIKNYQRELNSLESLTESIKAKEKELNTELKAVLLRLSEINAVQRENSRERKLRETVSTLKRIFPNVRGLLNDICKPKQKKYGVSVAAILGKNFDSIVVDTVQTASECIEYMKEQRLGVASFIPLDTVKIKPLDSNLRKLSNTSKLVIDVISYPPEYEKAIQYVCGDSLVCDTIETATYLRWNEGVNVRIVTLDGSLIHKNGLMTGGGSENFNSKWDKSEITLLTQKKDELKLKLSELHSKIPDDLKGRVISDEIERLKSRMPEYEREIEETNRALRDVDIELNFENRSLDDIGAKSESLENLLAETNKSIESEKSNIRNFEQQIYGNFCDRFGFENIEDYELNHSARIIQDTRENAKYVKEIQRLEMKLKFETERLNGYQERILALEKDRQKFNTKWLSVNKEKEKIEDEIDDLVSDLEVTKESYNSLKAKAQSLLSEAGTIEVDIENLKSDLRETKSEIETVEEKIESIKIDKKKLLVTAKLENVKLPLISGSLDDVPLEDGRRLQDEISQEWEDALNDLDINYSKLEDEYYVFIPGEEEDSMDIDDDNDSHTADAIEEKCKVQIAKLQQEINDMHPDIRAHEHLESSQARYKEIELEFNNAKNEEKDIVVKFEKIRDERHSLFMKAFDHVSSHIDEVYKELTKSKASPLGGSAYLTLEDEDEPYSFGIKYHIMPPLKRFRDMENLSGGEKTIGALALLFAIHSFHPSPFFVLDEVDAALDNSNINKIANYISKNRGPDFQFIVISLKNNLFEKSDSLVGIYRDQEVNSSKILTVDLREYAEA